MIHFGLKDAIDILIVAFFLYKIYRLMKNSGSIALFFGVLSFVAIWVLISQVLEMRLMGAILDKFISVGVVVLVILFQDEIRRFLLALGSSKGWNILSKLLSPKSNKVADDLSYIMPIVLAAMNMAKSKTGALIVIQQQMTLDLYIQTGEVLNANLSSHLLENIFFKNSPLHDGAVIISEKKIKAASCILPVSQKSDIPKGLGLRHRSALGMSQETDAKVIVISEESGKISIAEKGKLYINISGEELQKRLIIPSDEQPS